MESYRTSLSRRNLLKRVAGIAVYGVASRANTGYVFALPQTSGRTESHSNPNANKFADDRSVRPFAGNTVICPLPKDSPIFRELTHVHDEFAQHAFAQRLALLPPSSYHSTIFSGADDHDRQPNLWPADIALDTPITKCNRILAKRLSKVQFPLSLPLRFRLDADPQNQSKNVSTIRLLPFDEAENQKIRGLRNRLSEAMKIHAPDHDRYRFHISLGYWVQPQMPEELADYEQSLARVLARLTSVIHSIELPTPVFCTFNNMLAFDSQGQLNIVPPS